MNTTTENPTLQTTSNSKTNMTLVLAFAGVYILWGSTYLAIRVVLHAVPLGLMAGIRFLIASSFMFAWALVAKHAMPNKKEIFRAIVAGFLLLAVSNATVLAANKYFHSTGVIAVLVAITPFWVVLLQWALGLKEKPTASAWLGIALGMIGMGVLVGPENLKSLGDDSVMGIGLVLFSSLVWAIGTIYAGSGTMPKSPTYNTGIQMFTASMSMSLYSIISGDWQGFDLALIDAKVVWSFVYLVIGGSILGFSAFTYIARNASASSATTYAYVNPIIALFLGWWLGNEVITLQTILASSILIIAVALVVIKPKF